ncbi:hypothetical protein LOTGIDRAFT_204313 [Lottia gigantea]|uniref:Pyroglutamyl-peptidase I n=1 Tax=Lottia gigantea TaxID=225164 RepID=V4BLK9_LOTGI|nr:hypothetical protein LOTGIDRAFT_204313 [Lottia gigantea]ESO89584.1 hypothetical protein LOTGIDRAFT_204313 [Lottia gigantea]
MGSKPPETNVINSNKTVVVTGFGPFSGHDVNASWESVKELKQLGLGENIKLVIQELPVEYESAQKLIPQLWQTNNPDLVIHVGVSSMASELTLEQKAHNDGYCREDVKGTFPLTECCVEGGDNCIVSGIDMKHVCEAVNNLPLKIKSIVSHDAGRYLCDFSYYRSLHIDQSKAAFIHVPPLNTPYTASEIAEGLKAVILCILKREHPS